MLPVARDRGAYDLGLALEARVIDARAATDPILRRAAVERMEDRRRHSRVAYAHFAKNQEVRLKSERLHPEGHRRRASLLIESGFLGDVAGGLLQRKFVDFERDAEGLADLVDGRAAGGEI